jgi:hypothetical protein
MLGRLILGDLGGLALGGLEQWGHWVIAPYAYVSPELARAMREPHQDDDPVVTSPL